VRVEVHESRADDMPGDVHGLRAVARSLAHPADEVSRDAHIAAEPRGPAAVHHHAAAQNDVHLHLEASPPGSLPRIPLWLPGVRRGGEWV